MRNKTKIIFLIIFFITVMLLINCKVYAVNASFSVNKKDITVNEGETSTFSITANNCGGKFNIKSSDPKVIEISTTDEWIENGTKTITFKAIKAGNAIITVSAEDVSSVDENAVTGSQQINVSVKKSTPSNPEQPTVPNEPEKPEQVQFNKKNETVYATKSVNVRASYSTSSKIIGYLNEGDSITRVGIATKSINGITWSKVSYNGTTAYVSSTYLTTKKPEIEQENIQQPEEKPQENTTNEETQQSNETDNQSTNIGENVVQKGLSNLTIENIQLSPKFSSNVYEYTVGITEDLSSLQIKTTLANTEDSVEIAGNENLKEGENIITILVTSKETGEVTTYQIIVNKNITKEEIKASWFAPATWGKEEKIVISIIGVLVLIIIVSIIIKIKIAHREEEEEFDLPGGYELDKALIEHQELNGEDEENEKESIREEFYRPANKKGKHF